MIDFFKIFTCNMQHQKMSIPTPPPLPMEGLNGGGISKEKKTFHLDLKVSLSYRCHIVD